MNNTSTINRMTERELDDLTRAHIPLVGHLVRDLLGRLPAHVNRDDLTSAGLAGLVTATHHYDPERGIPFARFAATRIRGALLDELRGLDWASRSVRHHARQMDTARQHLTATLGRTPTNAETAQHLGIATSELTATDDDVQRAVVLSLQGFTGTTADHLVTEHTPGPEDLLLHREQIGYLHHAISALPERLRTVVTRYYLQDEPMTHIAAELNVTESRISQLRAEALALLKDGLNTHLDPDNAPTAEVDTCVTRRRTTYYRQISTRSTVRTRLAYTNQQGIPLTAVPVATAA